MERPEQDAILQALKQLYFLDAIDEFGIITDLGIEMCRFPLEPSYSKSLIASIFIGCVEDMVTLVSILSSENIWSKPPRVKEQEYHAYEKKLLEFVNIDGDHQSMIKIYNRWKKNKFSDQFCRQNFLNSRALKTAENIKVQLFDLLKNTDHDKCLAHFCRDPVFTIFQNSLKIERDYLKRQKRHKYEENDSEHEALTPSDLFRMALTTGFFYNSARKLHNNENLYLLIYPEGNVVDVDPQSIYAVTQEFPSTVIFTELGKKQLFLEQIIGGTQIAKGVIRLLSKVQNDWIKHYLPRIHNCDVFQLAGITLDTKRIMIQRNKKDRQDDVKEDGVPILKKGDRVFSAKERYQERKKQKNQ